VHALSVPPQHPLGTYLLPPGLWRRWRWGVCASQQRGLGLLLGLGAQALVLVPLLCVAQWSSPAAAPQRRGGW